jgi:hypothetical protein
MSWWRERSIGGVPQEIRRLEVGALAWLAEIAAKEKYSARGDHAVLDSRLDEIERAYILVHGPDTLAGFRCVVAVFFGEGDGRIFTLDVAPAHFKQFSPLKPKELLKVSRELLYILPGPGA